MKRHYYAYHSPRGFGNEFDVIAFPSKAARDKWLEGRSTADHWALTRAEARKLLKASFFDPGTIDARGGNVYLRPSSDRHGFVEDDRKDQCQFWIGSNIVLYQDERTEIYDTFCARAVGI